MDVGALLIVMIIAWITQIGLGYWQIKRFNHAYINLSKKGRYIGIGRSSGYFKPKIVIILVLDNQKKIVDSLIIKGLTVFSHPKTIPELNGKYYQDINPEEIFKNQPRACEALKIALTLKE